MMVDNLNPTNQFHPYQPPEAMPVSERPAKGLNGMLEKVGLSPDMLRSFDAKGSVNKVRDYARAHPAKAIGALALAAIGLGMLRRR